MVDHPGCAARRQWSIKPLLAGAMALAASAAVHTPGQAAGMSTTAPVDLKSIPAEAVRSVYVSGEIENGDYQRFLIAADLAQSNLVVLNSSGGVLQEALQIAEKVAERQIDTFVAEDAQCHSACMIIFLAGERRYVERGAELGLHAASDRLGDVSVPGTAVMSAFLGKVGVPLDIVRKISEVGGPGVRLRKG